MGRGADVFAAGRWEIHGAVPVPQDQPTCQKTCMGHTCDFWSAVASNTRLVWVGVAACRCPGEHLALGAISEFLKHHLHHFRRTRLFYNISSWT